MKKRQKLEQSIFVLMKLLNAKVEKKPSRIRSLGHGRDIENRVMLGVQNQASMPPPLQSGSLLALKMS